MVGGGRLLCVSVLCGLLSASAQRTHAGAIVAWGYDGNNEVSNAPSDTGFTAIAAGAFRHYLSGGGQVRTVSVVDVEAVHWLKQLENKPSLLQPDSALPGKLSGSYTELSAVFEIMPNSPRSHFVSELLRRNERSIA
jgi:hypothetical protein